MENKLLHIQNNNKGVLFVSILNIKLNFKDLGEYAVCVVVYIVYGIIDCGYCYPFT